MHGCCLRGERRSGSTVPRGSVPDRADFCGAGWIQQSGARDEDVGPSPKERAVGGR
jgi:hypothetical protein